MPSNPSDDSTSEGPPSEPMNGSAADLERRTREAVIEGLLCGAGQFKLDGSRALWRVASLLFIAGLILGVAGGLAVVCGLFLIIIRADLGQDLAIWGFYFLESGIGFYVSGALLNVLLNIEEHLRELRNHLRKTDPPTR